MDKFYGPKFYLAEGVPVGTRETQIIHNDHVITTIEVIYNDKWKMTESYKRYLREKKEAERQQYINVLKHKLQWQYDTYGEVDEIDFQEYMAYVKGIL